MAVANLTLSERGGKNQGSYSSCIGFDLLTQKLNTARDLVKPSRWVSPSIVKMSDFAWATDYTAKYQEDCDRSLPDIEMLTGQEFELILT